MGRVLGKHRINISSTQEKRNNKLGLSWAKLTPASLLSCSSSVRKGNRSSKVVFVKEFN